MILVCSSKLWVKARLQPDHQDISEFFPLLSETHGSSHYAAYVALVCMSAEPPPSKPSVRKGLHFSLCSSCQHTSLLVLAAGWGWGIGIGRHKGNRIFMLFDGPTELCLGFRLTLQAGGTLPGSGNIMGSVGWMRRIQEGGPWLGMALDIYL